MLPNVTRLDPKRRARRDFDGLMVLAQLELEHHLDAEGVAC